MDPALCEEFCAEYTRHLNELRNEKNAALIAARAEHENLAREKENLIQAIKDGVPASEIKDDLARIALRREELEARLCHINWGGREVQPALGWPDAPALLQASPLST